MAATFLQAGCRDRIYKRCALQEEIPALAGGDPKPENLVWLNMVRMVPARYDYYLQVVFRNCMRVKPMAAWERR